MPRYEYACTSPECGNKFELVQSFTDPAASECPACGNPVRKVYGSVGVVFKGSGFYRTDSRAGANGGKPDGGKTDGSSAKSGDTGKSGEGKSGEGKSGDGKPAPAKSGDSKTSAGSSNSSSAKSSSSAGSSKAAVS